jgi:beta-galactosidase
MGILAVGIVLGIGVFMSVAGRTTQNINMNWKFIFNSDNVAYAGTTFSDASWQTVSLPHTFQYNNARMATDEWRGVCWYRKSFNVDASAAGKKVFLRFEGAMSLATMYVNGTQVRTHVGGYTPFTIDVTNNVTPGAANELAMRLDNTPSDSVPPWNDFTIDYMMFGGLYRDVYLIVSDKLYIPDPVQPAGQPSGGTFIRTPSVSTGSASLLIKTVVKNEYAVVKLCGLKTTIIDNNNAAVATISSTHAIAAGGSYTFVQNGTVTGPSLWSPTNPVRYTAISEVSDSITPVDTFTARFGIRSILFNANGFFLNGQSLKLLGLNHHQTYPYIGGALPDNGQRRDAGVLKAMGCNYIRLSHYTQAPAFLDALDSLGIMAWEEVPTWQGANPTAAWINWHHQNIVDMIRRDRNHPSILLWGIGVNEGDNSAGFETPCQTLAKLEDSTHYTTAGRNYTDPSCNRFDIYGGNHFDPSWIPASAAAVGIGTGNLVGYVNSEYVGHTHITARWNPAQHQINQTNCFEAMIEVHNANNWISGGSGWCAFDYNSRLGSASRTEYVDGDSIPGNGVEYHGVCDLFRIPKFSYYFHQAQSAADGYNGSLHPMVFIESFGDYAMPSTQTIKVQSNCDSVELFVNNISQGKHAPDQSALNLTRWCACDGNANHWWMVDLGASYNLTGTQITWERATATYAYKIETSPNNTAWTLAVDKTGNTGVNPQVENDAITANNVRYVRVTVTSATADWASFYDFEAFSNGVNVALNKSATADCSQSPNLPQNALDNNGVPLLLRHPPFTFSNINYSAPGTLRAEGTTVGGTVRATQTVYRQGTPSKILLIPDTDTLEPDGADVARVVVQVVDANNQVVRAASNVVNVSVIGVGKVICGSAGPVTSGSVTVEAGQLAFLLQAGTSAGTITVTATSGTLTQAQHTFVVATQTVRVKGSGNQLAISGDLFIPAIKQEGRKIIFNNLDKNNPSRIMIVSLSGRVIENVQVTGRTCFMLKTSGYSRGVYVAVLKNGIHTVRKSVALLK